MTTLHAAPVSAPTVDPRDPEDRLARFFDPGSMQTLAPRDTSGVLAGRGTVDGSPAIAYCTDATIGDHPLVTATKGQTGHLLGAAGALESVFTILALRNQIVPATANLEDPDDHVAVQSLDIVRREPRKATFTAALNDSFGFGGHNMALVFTTV